jgi:hypothetical protein
MFHDNELTTAAIRVAFSEEVAALGGTVADVFDDGTRLFARSVLPKTREVLPKDRMQPGVALRATPAEIWVHPYLFRQVCSNGAILAHAVQSWQIENVELLGTEHAIAGLREAVRACAGDDAFVEPFEAIRSASERTADHILQLLPTLARLGPSASKHLMPYIIDRYLRDADRSRFGLMNAVTSVARDTRDPEVRWRLEELGGAIGVELPSATPRAGTHASKTGQLVGSGV